MVCLPTADGEARIQYRIQTGWRVTGHVWRRVGMLRAEPAIRNPALGTVCQALWRIISEVAFHSVL